MMQTTMQFKLLPTVQQEMFLRTTAAEYISLVNDIVEYALGQGTMPRLTSALVSAQLPSTLKAQAIQDARSVYKKCRKTRIHHVLCRPIIVWNNQNFKVEDGYISMPFLVDNHTQRLSIKADIPQERLSLLVGRKLGTLRVSQKNGKWVALKDTLNNGDGSITITLDALGPVAIMVPASVGSDETPTGETSRTALWIIVMVVALIAMVASVLLYRRRADAE